MTVSSKLSVTSLSAIYTVTKQFELEFKYGTRLPRRTKKHLRTRIKRLW